MHTITAFDYDRARSPLERAIENGHLPADDLGELVTLAADHGIWELEPLLLRLADRVRASEQIREAA